MEKIITLEDCENYIERIFEPTDLILKPEELKIAGWLTKNVQIKNPESAKLVDWDGEINGNIPFRNANSFSFRGYYKVFYVGYMHPYKIMTWGFEATNFDGDNDDCQTIIFLLQLTYDAHESELGAVCEYSGYNDGVSLEEFASIVLPNGFVEE